MVTRRQGLKRTTRRNATLWMHDLDEDGEAADLLAREKAEKKKMRFFRERKISYF
jgi:hypothetical protein